MDVDILGLALHITPSDADDSVREGRLAEAVQAVNR